MAGCLHFLAEYSGSPQSGTLGLGSPNAPTNPLPSPQIGPYLTENELQWIGTSFRVQNEFLIIYNRYIVHGSSLSLRPALCGLGG